jgi:hypothetical protein
MVSNISYIFIFALIIAVIVLIGTNRIGNNDNSPIVQKSLTTVYGVGGGLLGMVILLHIFMRTFPNSHIIDLGPIEKIMIYGAFFMSYMAFSISLIDITYS